jgi:hypothetical protein
LKFVPLQQTKFCNSIAALYEAVSFRLAKKIGAALLTLAQLVLYLVGDENWEIHEANFVRLGCFRCDIGAAGSERSSGSHSL